MITQIIEVTLLNLRNVPSRLGSSSVIVVGIAGVVAVLIGLLSMAAGFSAALESSSDPNRALVLRDGTTGELSSSISRNEFNVVSKLEGVSITSGELYLVSDIPKKATGTPANVIIRGVPEAAFRVRPEVRVVQGRPFEPGLGEVIVGIKANVVFAGLDVGDLVQFKDTQWSVVGLFESDGSAYESEIWADLAVAQTAFRAGGAISSIRLVLEDAAEAEALNDRIQSDPRLDLSLQTEEAFYRAQSQSRADVINQFGYAVAIIMAIGAVFAALNTMYTAVSARTVEIATLRALGFRETPVIVSVLIESLTLAVLGGALGAILVYLVFDGYTASTLNNASFSQVAFDFAVTPQLVQMGVVWALGLGLIGGLFPAVRAARLPITAALRGE